MNGDLEKFIVGGISGSIGAFGVFPIDLVKTRMQNQINLTSLQYKNSAICFKEILKSEGVLGFYRGCVPNVVCVFPEKAIKISVNSYLLRCSEVNGETSFITKVVSGGLAGAAQVIVTNPMEIIKIQMQMNGITKMNNTSIISVIRGLGITNLYRGVRSCLLRDIPFSFIYFPLYSSLKDSKNIFYANGYVAGMIAGGTAAFITTPLDVIKTRIQTKRRDNVKYTGIRHCFSEILKTEGLSAFYKGSVVRTLRSSIQFGITFAVYEAYF